MKRRYTILAVLGAAALVLSLPATSRAAGEFYEGKNIRFIVGFAVGGGYDAYTRMVARHIGRYIPGNPSTTVENMNGAGSVIAANYTRNKASRDGLTVGVFDSHSVFNHLMRQKSVPDTRLANAMS